MADYDEIKQNIINVTSEMETIQNDSKDKKLFRERTNKLLEELETKENQEIKQTQEMKLKEAEAESVRPIEDSITQADSDIQTLKGKFEQKRNELAPDNFLEEYTKEFEMLDEIRKLNAEVEEVASNILGEDMANDILNNLDNYEIDMNTENLEEYIKKHDKILKTLKLDRKSVV